MAGPCTYSASGRAGDEVEVVGARGCGADVKDYPGIVVDTEQKNVM